MATVAMSVGVEQIAVGLAAGTLPELIVGGVILIGALWLVKEILKYCNYALQNVTIEERSEGYYVEA